MSNADSDSRIEFYAKNTSEYVLAETLSLIFMRVLARRKSNIDNNGINVTT